MNTYSGALELFEGEHVRPNPGPTLIVGSRVYGDKPDRRKRYAEAVGIDMLPGEGVDIVLDLELPLPDCLVGRFSHVECMSVLEHSRRPWLLAANIQRMLAPGGTLFVSAPFVWRIHAYPDDYYRYTLHGLAALFDKIEWGKLAYAHTGVSEKVKIPRLVVADYPYFARTEACGFGVMP